MMIRASFLGIYSLTSLTLEAENFLLIQENPEGLAHDDVAALVTAARCAGIVVTPLHYLLGFNLSRAPPEMENTLLSSSGVTLCSLFMQSIMKVMSGTPSWFRLPFTLDSFSEFSMSNDKIHTFSFYKNAKNK